MAFTIRVEDFEGSVLDERKLHDGELMVGRSEDCELRLPSANVSRRHARFFVHLGRCYVEDMGSANGVMIDGLRLAGIKQLSGTTSMVMGPYVLRVHDARAEPSPPPAPTTSPAPRASRPSLAIQRAGRPTEIIALTQDAHRQVLDNDIVLEHASVQGTMYQEDGRWMVADLGSANGTLINQRPLTQPAVLEDGALIEFGDISAVYTSFPETIDTGVFSPIRGEGAGARVPVATLLASTLAVAGVVALSVMWLQRPAQAPSGAASDTEVAGALATALEADRRGDWQAVLNVSAEAEGTAATELERLRARASREMEAADALALCIRMREGVAADGPLTRYALRRLLETEASPAGPLGHGGLGASRAARGRRARAHRAPRTSRVPRGQAQLAEAVSQLEAAHALAREATSTRLTESLGALSADLRSSCIAAAEDAASREAWAEAVAYFTRAGSLGPLSEGETLAAARAQSALSEGGSAP